MLALGLGKTMHIPLVRWTGQFWAAARVLPSFPRKRRAQGDGPWKVGL
jgi:hypothetical protein